MLRILIVDDEQWIRKWLEKTVSELGGQFAIAAVADNGADALKILEKQQIDIVISDIQMPLATGLELAQAVQHKERSPKFIFISGYDRFAYVKQAIDLQVVSYLLKPIDRAELAAALEKAANLIVAEQKSGASGTVFREAIHRRLQSFLLMPEPGNLEHLLQTMDAAQYKCYGMYAGVFQFDISMENDSWPAAVVEQVLSEHFSDCLCFYILEDSMNYIFVAFKTLPGKPSAAQQDEELVRKNVARVSDKCHIQISQYFANLTDLPAAVAQARGRMLESYIAEKSAAVVDTSRGRLTAICSSILLAVRSYNMEGLLSNTALLQDMFSGKNSSFDDCRYALFSLISELIRMLADADGSFLNPNIARGYAFCVKINHYQNVPAMIEWFMGYAQQVTEYLEKNRSFNISHIAARVRNYLLEHYAEDISLSSICNQFEINASYFSKTFKKEIGVNFVDCLTGIRMDVASRLLTTTSMPVTDISKAVGIRDAKYFSKLFQSSFGVNPSKYREQAALANK